MQWMLDAGVVSIPVMSAAAQYLLQELRPQARTAAAELGAARIATPFDLWKALRDGGELTETQYRSACQRTANQLQPMQIPHRFR